jgi:polyphosphate kinase 2 (PPK2 family)
MDEQERRFEARIADPLRQMEAEPDGYGIVPAVVIRSDDKRRARLNCIAHLLTLIPHKRMQ